MSQTDSEAQNLLAPALSMSETEAANHYLQVANEWYNQQNSRAFKAFLHNEHIPRIAKLLQSKDKKAPLDAVRALAFIAASPRLHRQFFDCQILDAMVTILGSSDAAAHCEAALVVLNHLCRQSPTEQQTKYNIVSRFCEQKDSLVIIFRYAHVQDSCRSILANVLSVLAELCNKRQGVQERCIRAGIMERAYNLKTCNRERTVRTNADIFLKAMQLEHYSVDKYNEMHAQICIEMSYPSRALCLAIWRLVITDRKRDAEKTNTLFTVVHQIKEQDTTLGDPWDTLPNSITTSPSPAQPPPPEVEPPPMPKGDARFVYSNGFQPDEHKNGDHNGHEPLQHHHPNHHHHHPLHPQQPQQLQLQQLPKHSYSESVEEKEPNLRRITTPISLHQNDAELESCVQSGLQFERSWLEKDLHIAVLQTNPIRIGDGSTLALNAERKRLEEIFHRISRGLKFFFGVLTKESLIRCIQRGAQIVHISGHGPNSKHLEVEDKFGNAVKLSTAKIKEAIEKGYASKKHGGLQLVFVSTCHSEWVARSFCDAGVPHAVAVHSEVLILDKMATKFASAFYEALLAQHNSVEEAFRNSKAELMLEPTDDCCCSHQGHHEDCHCPYCKKPRCCRKCHGAQSKCPGRKEMPCCQPTVPHSHSDKFLLLPNTQNHRKRILANLANGDSERIDCRPPTNIAAAKQRIMDRANDTFRLVGLLHPESPARKAKDAVWIYGRPKVGLTALSLEVGRFFTRAWYQPIFPGGVFRVNLAKCYDPKTLFLCIAQAMGLELLGGAYLYWDSEQQRYVPYRKETQSEILKALSGDNITVPIETVNVLNGESNYILLRGADQEEVRHVVGDAIYRRFLEQRGSLPLEFGIHPDDDEKVIVRKIKFIEPNEAEILRSIREYPSSVPNAARPLKGGAAESEKLFIIDHINFPIFKYQEFLQKLKSLCDGVKCKLLVVCSDKMEPEVLKLQNQFQYIPKILFQRIEPISNEAAFSLLTQTMTRGFWPNDFLGIGQPASAKEMATFSVFDWLSKSPALIQHTATVLDRGVPFFVIQDQMGSDPKKWGDALASWQLLNVPSSVDRRRDAENGLTTLLTHIEIARGHWKDQHCDSNQLQQQRQRRHHSDANGHDGGGGGDNDEKTQ